MSEAVLTPSTAAEAPEDHPLLTENWPLQTAEPQDIASRFPSPMNVPVGQDLGPQTPEHGLQHCPAHNTLRCQTWPQGGGAEGEAVGTAAESWRRLAFVHSL